MVFIYKQSVGPIESCNKLSLPLSLASLKVTKNQSKAYGIPVSLQLIYVPRVCVWVRDKEHFPAAPFIGNASLWSNKARSVCQPPIGFHSLRNFPPLSAFADLWRRPKLHAFFRPLTPGGHINNFRYLLTISSGKSLFMANSTERSRAEQSKAERSEQLMTMNSFGHGYLGGWNPRVLGPVHAENYMH